MPRPATRTRVGTAVAQPISNFARVSKGLASLDSAVKKISLEPATTRKRKACTAEEEAHPRLTRRTVSFAPSSDDELVAPVKRARRQEPVSTPTIKTRATTKGKRTAKAAPKRTETAHKPVESTIIAKSRQEGKKVQTRIDGAFQKLSRPTEEGKDNTPAAQAELDGLNKAFMKTVMMHIAHNGTGSPIDVNTIIPHITRNWGKRKVTIDDIRRCIALQSISKDDTTTTPSSFSSSPFGFALVDRGGSSCMEVTTTPIVPISRDDAKTDDGSRIDTRGRGGSGHGATPDWITLQNLSLKELAKPHPSADSHNNSHTGSTAIRIKTAGENHRDATGTAAASRAGEGIRNGAAAIGRSHRAAPAAVNAAFTGPSSGQMQMQGIQATGKEVMLNPDGTKMSLLDRLRHKQLAKANGPLPPSPAELQRRAALNRVSDVAATISMLSLSNPVSLPRQAFTMAVILEKLRDSMRTPLSKEEGAACVRLIASEVAPEWLKIVTIGGRDNVVVQRGGQPVDRVIKERVQKLMA
ncbi:Fc.00g102490.m01.CDS01 [Cosmosporella sp. VM-42]